MIERMRVPRVPQRVRRAGSDLAGVDDAAVNFSTGRLNVRHDADLIDMGAFEAAVIKAGFVLKPGG